MKCHSQASIYVHSCSIGSNDHALLELPCCPTPTDYATGFSAKLREYQTGKQLVELPWRVCELIRAIGRDPALSAMRSNSKHDRHTRSDHLSVWECRITKWG